MTLKHLLDLASLSQGLAWPWRGTRSQGAGREQESLAIDYSRMRQRFDRKLSIRVSLAILGTILLALTVVAPSWRDFSLARQNLYDIQQYRAVLDAATFVAAERGPANIVMSEDPKADGVGARRLAEFRARTDKALAQLAATPAPSIGVHTHDIPPKMLADVRDQLTVARREVDRLANVPRASLKLDEFQGAITGMFEVSNKVQQIIAWKANALIEHDMGLAAPVLMGQMLSDLRDFGGRIGSQIIAPIATGERLPLQNVIDARRSQGRLLELWQIVRGQSALYDNSALAEYRADIDRLFFGEGLDLINKLIAQGLPNGEGYSMSATQFTERFVPTMRPVEGFRSAFLAAAVEQFKQARQSALATLLTATLATSLVLAVLIGLILSIRTHIFRPLVQAHEEVIRLAEDRPATLQPRSSQSGEILNLFQAIETLHGKLQERASVTSDLRLQAETDGLTALLNRRTLERHGRLPSAFGNAGNALCLVLLDIDHFKNINDTHGHLAGDRVLVDVAELLRSVLGDTGTAARFGGEEFAILLSGDDLPGAISLARRIRIALANKPFTTPEGAPLRVTASFGVASGHRGEHAWPELIALADAALYRAKSEGRNRVRFARHAASLDLLSSPATGLRKKTK